MQISAYCSNKFFLNPQAIQFEGTYIDEEKLLVNVTTSQLFDELFTIAHLVSLLVLALFFWNISLFSRKVKTCNLTSPLSNF